MLYLIWALLNTAIFIFFLVTCFRATKLVREKLGMLPVIVFVFGLLSFMSNADSENDNKEPGSSQLRTWKFTALDSLDENSTAIINVDLEKTWIVDYQLGIKYGKDKKGISNIPISAYSSANGWVVGTNWRPSSIIVNTNEQNQLEYEVNSTLEWKLLGMTVYAQPKNYNGTASLK